MSDQNFEQARPASASPLSRRSVVRGAAWAVPVVAVAATAPLAAASTDPVTIQQIGSEIAPLAAGQLISNLRFRVTGGNGQALSNTPVVLWVGEEGRFGSPSSSTTSITVTTDSDGYFDVVNLYRRTNRHGSINFSVSYTEASGPLTPVTAPFIFYNRDEFDIVIGSNANNTTFNDVVLDSSFYPAAVATTSSSVNTRLSSAAAARARKREGSGNTQRPGNYVITIESGAAFRINGAWQSTFTSSNLQNILATGPSLSASGNSALNRINDDDIVFDVQLTYNNGVASVTKTTRYTIPNPDNEIG